MNERCYKECINSDTCNDSMAYVGNCKDFKLIETNSIPVELPVGMPSENSFGQWVKTTDKFPKPEMMGEKILIVYKNEIHIGKIAPNGWNLFCSDGNCYFHIPIMDEVTHWMPLPKL